MLTLPWPVVLASASPRRVELLGRVVTDFEVLPANLDEDSLTLADPHETARTLACAKAREIANQRPEALVIGADTVVEIDGRQLSKPLDREEAIRMLEALSDGAHRVITGVCLRTAGEETSFATTTEVTFRKLSREEIESYVETGEPFDKAGGYAIQGGAEAFVVGIAGSLTNVVGLPLEELTEAMRDRALGPCSAHRQANGRSL